MRYSRGSEWNRWEFHIHTPGTLKNDHFSGRDIEEKWKTFYENILKKVKGVSIFSQKIML